MQNFSSRRPAALRNRLLASLAACALPLTAFAKDLPPTAEGAQKLSAVFSSYLGKPAEGAPSPITVTPTGANYEVAFDLAAIAAPFKASGFSLDPAVVKYALVEQDDGAWRVSSSDFPPISLRLNDLTEAFEIAGYKFDGVYDPALANFKSSKTTSDGQKIVAHGPQIDESFKIGAFKVIQTAAPIADGALSMAAHEEIADFSGTVSVTPPDDASAAPDAAKPTPFSFTIPSTLVDVGIDGLSSKKLLDLWAFLVAHPGRAEIAANEQAFKALLHALLPKDLKLIEKVELQKVAVQMPPGSVGLASGKFGLVLVSSSGPKSTLQYQFASAGIALPAGLLPPAMSDLAPTAFNFDIKASGFDLRAGAEEAIDDLHFAGDDPVIAEGRRRENLRQDQGRCAADHRTVAVPYRRAAARRRPWRARLILKASARVAS